MKTSSDAVACAPQAVVPSWPSATPSPVTPVVPIQRDRVGGHGGWRRPITARPPDRPRPAGRCPDRTPTG